ncbi:MAG: M48 family metallopeptidase [bacterium]
MAVGLQTHIWENKRKSIILLLCFPLLLLVIVYLITLALALSSSGLRDPIMSSWELFQSFIIYVLAGVVFWFFIAWGFHQSMILAMTHAAPLDRKDNPRVYNIVENLCISRGLPTPKLYIIEDESLNAYASGLSPKNALITFSRGIVDKLNDQELEAVAAHELSHIINYDIRLMVISIIFVGIIQTLSEFFLRVRIGSSRDNKDSGQAMLIILGIKLVVFILGFFFTFLVQMAISRKREYLADAGSVELVKSSAPLISALQKISQDSRIEVIENRSVAQMCIENPLSKGSGFLSNLFSTHPPIADRIKALEMIG